MWEKNNKCDYCNFILTFFLKIDYYWLTILNPDILIQAHYITKYCSNRRISHSKPANCWYVLNMFLDNCAFICSDWHRCIIILSIQYIYNIHIIQKDLGKGEELVGVAKTPFQFRSSRSDKKGPQVAKRLKKSIKKKEIIK